jgi:hypothetical protein
MVYSLLAKLLSDQLSLFRIETSVWFARYMHNFLRQFSFDRSEILPLRGDCGHECGNLSEIQYDNFFYIVY